MKQDKSLGDAALVVLEECQKISSDLTISFDQREVSLYYHNLRIDVQPHQLDRALRVIGEIVDLDGIFE
jgi:hypothetical protein